jgi:transposase
MASTETKEDNKVRDIIARINTNLRESTSFESRRKVRSTQTIFYDSDLHVDYFSSPSPATWCTITERLESIIKSFPYNPQVNCVCETTKENDLRDEDAIKSLKSRIPDLLKLVVRLYSAAYISYAEKYMEEDKEEHIQRYTSNRDRILSQIDDIIKLPSVFQHVKREIKIKSVQPAEPKQPPPIPFPRKRTAQEVVELSKLGKYSMKDICRLSKISTYQYYRIIKQGEQPLPQPSAAGKLRLVKSFLRSDEINYFKELADDPTHSYTVPEMRSLFSSKFGFEITNKVVYYHLTRTLGYSYKKSHFKQPRAFMPLQKLLNFKASIALLELLDKGKNIIALDESAFGVDQLKEYSYAKKGNHPFRIKKSGLPPIQVTMAITNTCVLGYQIRHGAANEHSFISFMLDLLAKIHSLGPSYISSVALLLDNAPYHKSEISKQFLELLPFPVLFNAPYNSDLNPIESVFGIIKGRMKRSKISSV